MESKQYNAVNSNQRRLQIEAALADYPGGQITPVSGKICSVENPDLLSSSGSEFLLLISAES